MDEQLRPVDGPVSNAAMMAIAQKHQLELDALGSAEDAMLSAMREFRAGCPIAGRLDTLKAINLLNAALRGEVG
ncbi:hypothetical protein ACFPIF_15695 [Brevundimonas faecalis]|uniref:hypothetical protein n=1 Tax=Brevundimonas faecalis TaxID=947378 RepID=UPI0036152884